MTCQRKDALNFLEAAASEHGTLLKADVQAMRELPVSVRSLAPNQDAVRQGDKTHVAIFILEGMLGRYHTLSNGDRQYLSLHIQGDMPDVQSLLLEVMDHSVCALGGAQIALFDHQSLKDLFVKRPALSFAFWRMTLIDAAIFRQHITDNGARGHAQRLAHLCCEQFVRASKRGLVQGNMCNLPLTQLQLGQLLGMSHISLNRALQRLRTARLLELKSGKLVIADWNALKSYAAFDEAYLHLSKDSEIAKMTFRGRS
jgi:CRP-like cAMP-binding protein